MAPSHSKIGNGTVPPLNEWEACGSYVPLTYACKGCGQSCAIWEFSDSQKALILRRSGRGARCSSCCETLRQTAANRAAAKALDKAAKEADKRTCRLSYECHLCRGYNDYNKAHSLGPFLGKPAPTSLSRFFTPAIGISALALLIFGVYAFFF